MLKKGNKVVPVTLTPYHLRKLRVIKERTGLNNTGVFQRLLEGHNVFGEDLASGEGKEAT